MLSFFVMGMIDIVGVATNFARRDFGLNDLTAGLLPMMVFLWFAIFSIPAGILMTKIGRKNTVMSAIALGVIALLIPNIIYSFNGLLLSFTLLGISNTILQVSLNPLISDIVHKDKLAGALTFGQFVKAVASFVGPIIASMVALRFGDWRLVLIVYALLSFITVIYLYKIRIERKSSDDEETTTSFRKTLSLLKDKVVLQLFIGVIIIVGIDVCMNTNTPELLIRKLGLQTDTAGLGSSLYFGARTTGALFGSILLLRFKPGVFLKINMIAAIAAFFLLIFSVSAMWVYGAIVLIGFTCANVFSILFTFALQSKSKEQNEVSSLMIMGVAGGAIITPIVGFAAQLTNISWSYGILLLLTFYLLNIGFTFSTKP